jgi:rhamnose transport system substrate-binding protein
MPVSSRGSLSVRLGLSALLVALLLSACGSSGSSGSSGSGTHANASGGSSKGKSYKIFMMPQIYGIPYTNDHKIGALQAAKELGDQVTYNGPTTLSATQQVAMIDNAVRQGYNAIVMGADDPNAVVPAMKQAMARGVKVLTFGADVAQPSARTVFISPPPYKAIGEDEVKWLAASMGTSGDIAILSSTPTKLDQNTWIKYMKELLATPKYKNIHLVKIAYGNDIDTQDAQQTTDLLQAYPNLKGIISPTAVGLPAAARVVTQAGKCGKVAVTGIALPSAMKTYVSSGCVKKFGLWSPISLGYLGIYAAHEVLDGKLKGTPGETFTAGKLGKFTVGPNGVVPVSPPLIFTSKNIKNFPF